MDLTGFYWCLLVVTGIYCFFWVLLGFIGFDWVLLDLTGFDMVLLDFYWFLRVLLGFTGFYWVLLGFTGFYFGGWRSGAAGRAVLLGRRWRRRRVHQMANQDEFRLAVGQVVQLQVHGAQFQQQFRCPGSFHGPKNMSMLVRSGFASVV